jgi:hypothetical protein
VDNDKAVDLLRRSKETIEGLVAERDRALESVERLRGKGNELRLHIDYDRWPNECDAWDRAIAATEPATVEQNKEP